MPGTRSKLRRERKSGKTCGYIAITFLKGRNRNFEVSAGNQNFSSWNRLILVLAFLIGFDDSLNAFLIRHSDNQKTYGANVSLVFYEQKQLLSRTKIFFRGTSKPQGIDIVIGQP